MIHNDNIANAFVLPGGAVVVYTGMLRQCTTDDLLATVMGHEIGHVVAVRVCLLMMDLIVFTLVDV